MRYGDAETRTCVRECKTKGKRGKRGQKQREKSVLLGMRLLVMLTRPFEKTRF